MSHQKPHAPRRVSDLAISLLRTWVPILVAAVVAWIAVQWGIVVPDHIAAEAVVWITAGLSAVYYYLARRLEQARGTSTPARIARAFGRWMLGGVVATPSYQRGVPSG